MSINETIKMIETARYEGDGLLGPEIDLDVDGEWLEPEADGADEVLDKIRAEIEAEPYISKMEVLEIIDKYRTESEVRNDT